MPTINDDNNFKNQNLDLEKKNELDEVRIEISKLASQILQKIKNMEEDIWVIDRFEKNLAVCENRKTKEKIEIEIEKLPKNVKEGSVLKVKDNKFEVDLEEEKNIEKRIQEKMKNIWND